MKRSSKSIMQALRGQCSPKGVTCILLLGVFVSGDATAAAAEFTFDQYDLIIDVVERQTVLTGFLLGGSVANIATVSIDETKDRRLRIYAFNEGAWKQSLDTTLPPNVSFVDVANVDGRDRLITYVPGRLNWFDPESAAEHELVAVTSSFVPPRKNEIPHVNVAQDVNGDGRDDLVVPDDDGVWVFVQMSSGEFADPVKIGPRTDLSRILGADGYRYDPWSESRVFEVDYDRDGRRDLVFWNEDHFEAHIQDKCGLFETETKSLTTVVAFDSDRLDSLITGDMTGTVLHTLDDLNGDGIADLVVFSLAGTRISRKRSAYRVHFGAPSANGGTAFAAEAGAVFKSNDSIQLGMDLDDFDGDGNVDVMITSIPLRFLQGSLWKELKGFMGDDVRLTLEFYRGKGGRFSNQPDTARIIALDGAPSHREPGWVPPALVLRGATHQARKAKSRWPHAFNPNLLIGDVTGDGRADLMVENTFRDLPVFVGVAGSGLFAQRPQVVKVVIPHDREYSRIVDLNRDGTQDIVMHHPFSKRDVHGGRIQPPGTEPHRVVLLIAR